VFLGTHEPKLDEKGRIILPARFRDELANGLVITKGQERCLYVFPSGEFSSITDRLRQAPVTEKAARDYMRVMFAGAHDEVPDNAAWEIYLADREKTFSDVSSEVLPGLF
jgi:MraZ protein